MLGTTIKYFFMALTSFYIFAKLLLIRTSKKDLIIRTGMAILLAIISYYVRLYYAPLNIFLFVSLLTGSVLLLYRKPIDLTVVTSVLASGLSYFAFVLASVTAMPFGLIGLLINNGQKLSDLMTFLLVGIIQFLLSMIPFRFSRLKKGMPFLKQYGTSDAGVFISISLLSVTPFFNIHTENDVYAALLIFFIGFCGIALLFWWKKQLTKQYKEKLMAEETARLQQKISELETRIEDLVRHNEDLAQVIHKDNKLLPAMEVAVKDMLLFVASSIDDYEKASELLEQITTLSNIRNNVLQRYESSHKVLPKTGILSTDGVIQYLQDRAESLGISFEAAVTGSIKFMAEQIISVADLNTLTADLLENALIAVTEQTAKSILLRLGILDSNYQIDVFDSGCALPEEVLCNLGHKQTTTHANSGGSGIGLMNIWSLMKKYNASFELDETITYSVFTKRVSVCFDGKQEYRIKTNCQERKNICAQRQDIRFL